MIRPPTPHRLLHRSPTPKRNPSQDYPHPSSKSTHSNVSDSPGRVQDAFLSHQTAPFASTSTRASSTAWQFMGMPQTALLYSPETTLGSEFSGLSDFLDSLDERSFFNPPPTTVTPALMSAPPQPFTTPPQPTEPPPSTNMDQYTNQDVTVRDVSPPKTTPIKEETVPVVFSSASKTERFLMIAADQEPGPRPERLNRVIRSKYEAGLLKPYNYVKGYARLQKWMDSKCAILLAFSKFVALTGLTPHSASPKSPSKRFCNHSRFSGPSSECVVRSKTPVICAHQPLGNRSIAHRYGIGVYRGSIRAFAP